MALSGLFEQLDRNDIRYVVLRRYEGLPDALESDVDIYVDARSFDDTIRASEENGFCHRSPSTAARLTGLFVRAGRDPSGAIREVVASPGGVFRLLVGRPNRPRRGFRNRALRRDGLLLDFVNHLAYTSPYDGHQVRVDPSIGKRMLDRSRQYNGFSIPAPVDELAHLVPHCVFDKNGTFPDHYATRCDYLFEEVSSEPKCRAEFDELLGLLFYRAADLVSELVAAGEYDAIREELIRFDDY